MKVRQMKLSITEGVTALRHTIESLISWIIGFPLTLLIGRDPGLTAVVGREGGMFADNGKYFFVYASGMRKKGERVVLLTPDADLRDAIIDAGGDAVCHPTLRSLSLLLRCGSVVTDLFVSGYYPLTRGAKLIQIWHGAPLKHIELDTHNVRLAKQSGWQKLALQIQKNFIGRYPTYDTVATTSSKLTREIFQRCFKAKRFVATGYPRNDILFGWPVAESLAWRLAWINVDRKALDFVAKARNDGKTVCLYAPTFRKDMSDPFHSVIDLPKLSAFARENNIVMMFKLHPFMHGRYTLSKYPNLMEYEPRKDVYPLMAMSDILITDYSSIYFDYLLLDRPIVFFPYDLEHYLSEDRDMYFDYESVTPGAKCRNQDDMERHLKSIIIQGLQDDYASMRMKVRTFAHDHVDNLAARRLYEGYIQKL